MEYRRGGRRGAVERQQGRGSVRSLYKVCQPRWHVADQAADHAINAHTHDEYMIVQARTSVRCTAAHAQSVNPQRRGPSDPCTAGGAAPKRPCVAPRGLAHELHVKHARQGLQHAQATPAHIRRDVPVK